MNHASKMRLGSFDRWGQGSGMWTSLLLNGFGWVDCEELRLLIFFVPYWGPVEELGEVFRPTFLLILFFIIASSSALLPSPIPIFWALLFFELIDQVLIV